MEWLLHGNKRALLSWLWLLVPPLAAVALQVGFSTYCRHTRSMLDWRLSLAQVVPDMVAQSAAVREETRLLILTPEQRESIVEILDTKLHNLVRQDGFRINSLSAEKSGVVNGLSLFHVALTGVGDIPAMASFLHAVQTSDRLMCLDHARLTSQRGEDARNYTVELSFRYLVIPP